MTENRIQQIGSKVWNSSFYDNIKLMNNSPIENIVSCKMFPFDIPGVDEEITIGNVEMGVNGKRVSKQYNYKRNIGSIPITGMYNSFLDYEPFTKLTIFFPFIGFFPLDCTLLMGKTLRVDYITDLVTGNVKALTYANNVPIGEYNGTMGVDVPIAASNRAQIEAGYVTSFVKNIMENPAKGVFNTVLDNALNQYHTNMAGGVSPSCSTYQTRDCYVIYDRPTFQELKAFNHTRGRMCNLSKTIGLLSGYTEVDRNIDLSGVNLTKAEKEELRNILSSGFFA